jgi:hypothetical protein
MGFEVELVHQMIRDCKILSMIPVRRYENPSASRTRGRHRRQMVRTFDEKVYHQRNKCETIYSVIKRRFGSKIMAWNNDIMTKELLFRVLAYNCHRMCRLSFFIVDGFYGAVCNFEIYAH